MLTHISKIHLSDLQQTTNWGPWKLDLDTMTLAHTGYYFYLIPLEQISSSGQMLDWIFQICAKRWVTAEDQAHLIEALRMIYNPQYNLCPFGQSREIDAPVFLKERFPKMTKRIVPPKFKPGQRVRLSAAGEEWLVAPKGSEGTVKACGLLVMVQIDGRAGHEQYSPDFWDAISETATSH